MLFLRLSSDPTSSLATLDPETETLLRDQSAPASLSLALDPLSLLGGEAVENSGESGEAPMYGEASGSEGGLEEARGVGLEEIGGLLQDVLQGEAGVPCRAVGLRLDSGGVDPWVEAGLGRQEAG